MLYISGELEARLDPEHRTTADLVIEVISPGSAIYDRNTKADTYAALGVEEMWLVEDTQAQVEVRNQTGNSFDQSHMFTGEERIVSGALQNLTLSAAKLFAD